MSKALSDPDYRTFLAAVKERVLHARTSAARAVNRDLILLYWDIGRGIVEKQQTAGWGDAVVEQFAADLRAEFPDMRGFSAFNLWRMRRLYSEYSSPEFLAQAASELRKMPGKFLAQAVPEIGSPGQCEFLEQAVQELKHHAGNPFLEQLVQESGGKAVGQILARTGPDMPSQVVRELVSLVPWGHHVELMKKTNLLNEKERAPDDQPSIGIILCAEKDDIEVEFALKTKTNPIGVAEYQLQSKLPAQFKGRLPTAKQLSDVVREVLPPKK